MSDQSWLYWISSLWWQVQPGGRSEVRGDRARDGDRLSENLRHKGLKLKQTHSHTSTLQEHLTDSGKLGIFSNILMLGRFFFPLTFFITKKQLGYVSCFVFVLFSVNKSSSAVVAGVSVPPTVSFRDQNSSSSRSRIPSLWLIRWN